MWPGSLRGAHKIVVMANLVNLSHGLLTLFSPYLEHGARFGSNPDKSFDTKYSYDLGGA